MLCLCVSPTPLLNNRLQSELEMGRNYLYDPEILKKHNLGERFDILKHDETLCVRPLCDSDYDCGFLELLKDLTEVGNISREQFQGIL